MYAIIATGGKQYQVAKGQLVRIEKLAIEVGGEITFDQVLLLANGQDVEVGAPFLPTTVKARVIEHGRGQKVRIIKMKRRKHHMKHQGHRQHYTMVQVTDIGSAEQTTMAAAA